MKDRTVPHIKTNLIAIIFMLMIFSIPLLWLILGNNPQERSVIEARNLKKFSLEGLGFKAAYMEVISGNTNQAAVLLSDLLEERSLQTQLEKAASDQFPLRISAIKTAKAIDRWAINLVYRYLPDLMLPADMQADTGLFIYRDESGFIFSPKRINEEIKSEINNRIDNYTQIINTYPKINFYLYYIERITYSQHNPMNQYFYDADKGQALAYFEKNRPEKLVLGKLILNSYDDYLNYYFRTDHHWNIHGALVAYQGIYQLLEANLPETSTPGAFTKISTLPDVLFLGSSARTSMYPIKGEEFEIIDFNLPPFKTILNGQEISYSKSAQYLAGDYSKEPYINHYGEYFGYDQPMIEFVFDNQSDRQLLIISNSFDNPRLPLVASHYAHTYSVNLLLNENFSLSNFLSQNLVDDILIVGENDVAFSSEDWLIKP